MNHKLKYIIILLIITTGFARKHSGVKGIISEDFRYELKTQEIILERIIKHYDKNKIISHGNVTSYYIEDYGALFEVQRFPTSETNLFNQFGTPDDDSKTRYLWSEEKNAVVKFESKHGREDSLRVVKMVDEHLKDLHLAVFEFFADYMSASSWIKENEKVCIHFDINMYRQIPKKYDQSMVENIVPIALQASVGASDLAKFHKGNLSIKQFDQKIKIDKIMVDPQTYNYKILGDVIESDIKSIKEGKERPFSGYTTSIKISDLGVLCFVVAQHNSSRSFNDVGSIFEYLFGNKSSDKDEKDEENMFSKSLIELKLRIAESVGQYGHKLDDLNENQWIVLLVNIGKNYGDFKSRFVMKIQKKYVDAYAGNQLSFEEFEEHVQIYDEEINN